MILRVFVLEKCLLLQTKPREPLQNHLVKQDCPHQVVAHQLVASQHTAPAPIVLYLPPLLWIVLLLASKHTVPAPIVLYLPPLHWIVLLLP